MTGTRRLTRHGLVNSRVVTATAVAMGLLMAGCSGSGATQSSTQDPAASASPAARSATTAAARSGTDPASPSLPAESPVPTLPPGDPGADAPGTDDPNAEPPDAPTSKAPSERRPVPRAALLDAASLGSITGSSWTAVAVPADSCTAPRIGGSVARRSTALRAVDSGRLVETVATYVDADAATAAVRVLARRLAGCPGGSASDPRLGDASMQATVTSADGTSTLVTAIAAEGVTAVLAGTGPVSGEDIWPALTDLALGNTCAAAENGCH